MARAQNSIKSRYAKKLNAFGKHLKTIREGQGLTQEQISFKSGISFTTINKLENGKLNPTLATLYGIADVLKMDIKFVEK